MTYSVSYGLLSAPVHAMAAANTAATLSFHRRHHNHCRRRFTVSASISKSPPTSTSQPLTSGNKAQLPIRPVPGGYGLPLIGAIKDRLDYFYFEGVEKFFRSRIDNYKSTVFRVNMPPGPFISSDSRVVALLDAASFPILFDVSKVEKKDLFTGTYAPSWDLTGGYRILSYLDPSEPKHALLKKLLFYILSSRRQFAIPEFRSSFGSMFESMEAELQKNGKADFGSFNEQASFGYLAKSLFDTDPMTTELKSDAPGLILKWVFFQLSPILTLGLPFFLEDPILHTFKLPAFLVKSDYQRLYDFFYKAAATALDEAEKMGISREEACHNIVFATCFNSFGGMKIFFPTVMKWIGGCTPEVHAKLAEEIRAAVKKHGGVVTMKGMEEDMPLMKSVVYETFRIEPPVPFQYAKAKQDMVIQSHDSAFEVKKGEMLFGYQPFVTKDGRVFERPEEFVPDRFVGVEGEKLIKYVVWSNGPETESPTTENKQCAGKEFVVLMARLLVVETFLRYDTFKVEASQSTVGSSLNVTSLKKLTA